MPAEPLTSRRRNPRDTGGSQDDGMNRELHEAGIVAPTDLRDRVTGGVVALLDRRPDLRGTYGFADQLAEGLGWGA